MSAFAAAPGLLRNGYSVLPLWPDTGLPAKKGWDKFRDRPMSPADVRWWSDNGHDLQLAVVGGFNGLVPIDVDTDDPAILAAIKRTLPRGAAGRIGSKGYAVFFRDPTGHIASDAYQGPRNYLTAGKVCLVEVKARGNVTVPPSVHRTTRNPYTWARGSLFDIPIEGLSVITAQHLVDLEQALAPWCPLKPVYVPPTGSRSELASDKRYEACARVALERTAGDLASLRNGGRNQALNRAAFSLGCFVHHKFMHEADLRAALVAACQANGLAAEDGIAGCQKTISSGLDGSRKNPLPSLPDRPRQYQPNASHHGATA